MVNNILFYGVVVIRATRRVPLVEQELLTNPQQLDSLGC